MAEKKERKEVFATLMNFLVEVFSEKYLIQDHQNLIKTNNSIQSETDTAIRGHNAFQTDILISKKDEKENPLVVIELKTGSSEGTPTTHDVILYSAKSGKHKSIYPQIRYGMVWFNGKKVPNRFLTNNENMDFAFGFSDDIISKEKDREIFLEMLREQLKTAEDTLRLLELKTTASMFSSIIRYE